MPARGAGNECFGGPNMSLHHMKNTFSNISVEESPIRMEAIATIVQTFEKSSSEKLLYICSSCLLLAPRL